MSEILKINELNYTYKDGMSERQVLSDVNYEFKEGVFYTIMGESGSGKTTLLSLMGGLEKVQSGSIEFDGKNIQTIGLDNYRRLNRTMIFQNMNLVPYLSAYENVTNGQLIRGLKVNKESALQSLSKVRIEGDMVNRGIKKLSGGEQQRVAIARSLAIDVRLILADEPTGNLDKQNENHIIELFKDLAHKENCCVIVVTHSERVARRSDVTLNISKGQLYTNH